MDLRKGKGTAAERVFDRSFNLPQVGDDGRAVLLALSLFSPSASRVALAEVAGFGTDVNRVNEAVKHLAALRLVASTAGGRRLLVEGLTRELASNKLAASDRREDFRQRFVGHFEHHAGQHAHTSPENFGALEDEKENLLAALAIAFEVTHWQQVMSIRRSLEEYLDLRGYWEEAIRTGEMALQAAREARSPLAIARFTYSLAVVYWERGENVKARELFREGLEINRKLGEQSGIASSLHELGNLAYSQGNPEEARRLYAESLGIAKKLDHQSGIATILHQLGMLAHDQGNPEEARRLYGQSLEIMRKVGDQSGIASSLGQLGRLAESEGDRVEAAKLYREALTIFQALGSPDADLARKDLARLEGKQT
jgi:tetratricopeptide (TPR) repeat protein